MSELKKMLDHVQKTIHQAPDKVRYAMNMFVISLAILRWPAARCGYYDGQENRHGRRLIWATRVAKSPTPGLHRTSKTTRSV